MKEASESGFSWELIAKQVKTRNGVQCLRKWCKEAWLDRMLIMTLGINTCAGRVQGQTLSGQEMMKLG